MFKLRITTNQIISPGVIILIFRLELRKITNRVMASFYLRIQVEASYNHQSDYLARCQAISRSVLIFQIQAQASYNHQWDYSEKHYTILELNQILVPLCMMERINQDSAVSYSFGMVLKTIEAMDAIIETLGQMFCLIPGTECPIQRKLKSYVQV